MYENYDYEFDTALKIAEQAHSGQTRWGGQEYINHPIEVGLCGVAFNSNLSYEDKVKLLKNQYNLNYSLLPDKHEETSFITTAILHDVLEDSKLTEKDLTSAGISNSTIWSVILLTKLKNEPYHSYLRRMILSKDKISINVKVADISCNLQDLAKYPNKKDKAEKYLLALSIIQQSSCDLLFPKVAKVLNDLLYVTTDIGIFSS